MNRDSFQSDNAMRRGKGGTAHCADVTKPLSAEVLRTAVKDHGRNCVAKLRKQTGLEPSTIRQALKDAGLDPFAPQPKAFAGTVAVPKPVGKGKAK